MQKAFVQNINGTKEHNQVLQKSSAVPDPKKTVHCTFFDLKDAFGSISHKLIEICLDRYLIPIYIKSYIVNLYCGFMVRTQVQVGSLKSFSSIKGYSKVTLFV